MKEKQSMEKIRRKKEKEKERKRERFRGRGGENHGIGEFDFNGEFVALATWNEEEKSMWSI